MRIASVTKFARVLALLLPWLAMALPAWAQAGPWDEGLDFQLVPSEKLPQSEFDSLLDVSSASLAGALRALRPELAAEAINLSGLAYLRSNRYALAYERFLLALRVYRLVDDPKGKALAMSRLANVHFFLEEFEPAERLYRMALAESRRADFKLGLAATYNNLGETYREQGRLPEALRCYQRALAANDAVGNYFWLPIYHNNLGATYQALGQMDKAAEHFRRSLELAGETRDAASLSMALSSLGGLRLSLGEAEAATGLCERALELADSLEAFDLRQEASRVLAQAYAAQGRHQEAYQCQSDYLRERDSLFSKSEAWRVGQLRTREQIERSRRELQAQQRERELRLQARVDAEKQARLALLAAFGIVAAAMLVLLGVVRLRRKDRLALLESNQKAKLQNAELTATLRELRQKEKALSEAVASKDKFFSIIAHDLKNPFATLLTTSEYLLAFGEKLSPDRMRRALGGLKDSAQNGYNLLQNLLVWSRSQAGQIEWKPERVSLRELLEENTSLLSNMAEGKGVELLDDCPDELLALADRNMLATVLRNLSTNAIKFTPSGGTVLVEACSLGDSVLVEVSDNGLGVNLPSIGKLFRVDEQFSTPGTNKEKGSGLGLVLCREFVEKNGGQIWVSSELGSGSVFSFTVPAHAAAP